MHRYIHLWAGAVLLLGTPAVSLAADVVACDLFDEPTLSALVGVKLESRPNRKKSVINGDTVSDCIFRADRHSVHVTLWEYASTLEAAKKYAGGLEGTKRPKVISNVRIQYSVDDAYGPGDQSFWYQLASEQFGIKLLQANRILIVNFQFKDGASGSNTGSGLKERGRSVFRTALRKL